jgi:hypothetical protein
MNVKKLVPGAAGAAAVDLVAHRLPEAVDFAGALPVRRIVAHVGGVVAANVALGGSRNWKSLAFQSVLSWFGRDLAECGFVAVAKSSPGALKFTQYVGWAGAGVAGSFADKAKSTVGV